jgi:2-dehydro-3-deoxy-D-gluconate 5-dehydrogenase
MSSPMSRRKSRAWRSSPPRSRPSGGSTFLVNNAGIGIIKQPQEYTLAEWNAVLATNLSSAFLCAQAAYPEMLRAGAER